MVKGINCCDKCKQTGKVGFVYCKNSACECHIDLASKEKDGNGKCDCHCHSCHHEVCYFSCNCKR